MRLRRQFCRWALRMIREDSTFFQYVFFRRSITHYWSIYNPHWTQRVDNQHRWSLNTWCGIVNGYLIEEVDLATRQKMWQQDGAPPHSHRIVTEYLNNIFHKR
ncbi:hypothetical protein P5V15_015414 [Pogonomyrmex californicus]